MMRWAPPPADIAESSAGSGFVGAGTNAIGLPRRVHAARGCADASRPIPAQVTPLGTYPTTARICGLNWNAGGCCGDAMRSSIDDVGFTRALLDDLGHRAHFDRSRVYATGFSADG